MSVNAQKTWNFSTWEARDYTTTETIEDLTVVATSDKKIVIDGSNKTINDVIYTQRLKFGGSGAEDSRNVNFQVDGPCTIAIGATSSSNDADRVINVAASTFDNIIGEISAPGGSVVEGTVSYTSSEPTTIYVYSKSSGANIYYITVTPDGSAGINGVVAEGEGDAVISCVDGKINVSNAAGADVTVYDINGAIISKAANVNGAVSLGTNGSKGIFIVKVEGENVNAVQKVIVK